MAPVPPARVVIAPVVRVDHEGTAAEFHAARPEFGAHTTELHVYWLVAPALVIGSTQSPDGVDRGACASQGIDVVRRRSGGGAVLLTPGDIGWIDVVVPRGAPGWADDINAPMEWLGAHFVALLTAHDEDPWSVHRGALLETEWSRTICFDGVGAGEVLRGDAKAIGISQRRTRGAARMQCLWYMRYEPADLTALFHPPRPELDELREVATIGPERSTMLVDGLPDRLNS